MPVSLRRSTLSFVYLLLVLLATGARAEPRHVFLTYSGAPETSIDINIVMEGKVDAVQVYYDTEPHRGEREAYAHAVEAPYVPSPMTLSDGRALYVLALKDLEPGTTYAFMAGEERDGYSRELTFQTLPGGDAPIRFVNGGDMGAEGRAVQILRNAAKIDPHFAVLGGDMAYANGYLAENELVDAWLDNWFDYMRRRDGSLIPIMTAIGNHEVNKYASDVPELRAPWYLSLFGRQDDDVYYSRKVGDTMVFFMLDTGHLTAIDGEQAAWLAAELEKYKDVPHKFAVYHVPMYPAFGNFDSATATLARETWGPLFDRYGVRVAFEHHDHVAKRSKPIKGGEVADRGTVYVGDGAMGRESRDVGRELRWYNEMEVSTVHFWQVDVTKDNVKLQAIDRQEEVFDSFELP